MCASGWRRLRPRGDAGGRLSTRKGAVAIDAVALSCGVVGGLGHGVVGCVGVHGFVCLVGLLGFVAGRGGNDGSQIQLHGNTQPQQPFGGAACLGAIHVDKLTLCDLPAVILSGLAYELQSIEIHHEPKFIHITQRVQ